jgi:hypothetical protein
MTGAQSAPARVPEPSDSRSAADRRTSSPSSGPRPLRTSSERRATSCSHAGFRHEGEASTSEGPMSGELHGRHAHGREPRETPWPNSRWERLDPYANPDGDSRCNRKLVAGRRLHQQAAQVEMRFLRPHTRSHTTGSQLAVERNVSCVPDRHETPAHAGLSASWRLGVRRSAIDPLHDRLEELTQVSTATS